MRPPRVRPGRLRQLGLVNHLLAKVLSRGAGVREAHLFTTLGRNRSLFRFWLAYSGALMLGGRLPRRETELVILRVAHRCDSDYERRHHLRLGRRAGLTEAELERTAVDDLSGWKPFDAVLLEATDLLLATDDLDDATWRRVRSYWDERQVIEFCLLVGQYRGLAATIRVLGIAPDR
ncbi:carboxymuconolactone decarboxylase family protein [Aeromicrobium duanguangcaii]|uniref:Carboxymuconolactone decarboxylase family protein n=1 Tax=Aeromicrobium duanguangcaii TaxID=2968086 RepID=A0ABY5KA66_9ACTN|nr:carboxymuconolactone decarboxylase family protein [Aeromicrobium duanguangcaii]UUI67332.1 carboxymuconolactone decarboxylase family protein [Aeromicrobium duanguangcaii]